MQTKLADFIRHTRTGYEADGILRKCVHCGFCTATCPTYQLLGNELDGPRGRIYLIKEVLEGTRPSSATRLHLDRCLTCRACETTCPSGVHYSRLLDIGRHIVAEQAPRPRQEKILRWILRESISRPRIFAALYTAGQTIRPLLPARLKASLLNRQPAGPWPRKRHARRMLTLAGCAQPALDPSINAAAARVLDSLGISLEEAPGAGCCGAVRYHLDDLKGAQANACCNIDAWWSQVAAGNIERIVTTASACGVQLKDYAHLLQDNPAYASKAQQIAQLTADISEIIAAEKNTLIKLLEARTHKHSPIAVAWHAPCTLQHGLKLRDTIETLLQSAGFILTPVKDAHLCCGSAGTYALLQPTLSMQLRNNKLSNLQHGAPSLIASANIGCIHHLQTGTSVPVRHWIELIDARLNGFSFTHFTQYLEKPN